MGLLNELKEIRKNYLKEFKNKGICEFNYTIKEDDLRKGETKTKKELEMLVEDMEKSLLKQIYLSFHNVEIEIETSDILTVFNLEDSKFTTTIKVTKKS